MEYQNIKIVKSKFKSEKSNKRIIKAIQSPKKPSTKEIKTNMMSVMWPLNFC